VFARNVIGSLMLVPRGFRISEKILARDVKKAFWLLVK